MTLRIIDGPTMSDVYKLYPFNSDNTFNDLETFLSDTEEGSSANIYEYFVILPDTRNIKIDKGNFDKKLSDYSLVNGDIIQAVIGTMAGADTEWEQDEPGDPLDDSWIDDLIASLKQKHKKKSKKKKSKRRKTKRRKTKRRKSKRRKSKRRR
jgi:hypothetical protein